MPFDGLSLTSPSVRDRLRDYGIETIDQTVLTKHMKEQLKRYSPGWIYHHLHVVRPAILATEMICSTACLAFIVLLVVVPVYGMADNFADWSRVVSAMKLIVAGGMVSFGGLWLLMSLERVEIKGQPEWITRRFHLDDLDALDVPESIRAVVMLAAQMKEASRFDLVYGELRRDTVLLDPYIGIIDCRTFETAILGIWDGETVLHIAGVASC